MKNLIYLFAIFFWLFSCSSYVFAEIQLSNTLAKDIGKAYGFYLGQDYSLNEISKKYPAMSGLVLIAKKEFYAAFMSSIEGMDALMEKYNKTEWERIKAQLYEEITDSVNINQIVESTAREYIDIVRYRAKGNIESPIIETLLLFKSGYNAHPEREFLEGYKYKYLTNGNVKAKGIEFSIESPKTWMAKEGERPNIVQKFVSENGNGLELLLISIKDLPLQAGEVITEKEVAEILNSTDIKEFLPDGSEYIDSGNLTLESLPGFWAHYKIDARRARLTLGIEAIMYTIIYKNRMIQIQGQVIVSKDGEPVNRGGFKRYERLFDLMVNSFILPDMYN